MLVKVLKPFADKMPPYKMHYPNDMIDVSDERAKDMEERGLAVALAPTSNKSAEKAENKPTPKGSRRSKKKSEE